METARKVPHEALFRVSVQEMFPPSTLLQAGFSLSGWIAHYRWHKQKPYYEIRFAVLEPKHLGGCAITGRLYCTPRAMWKLSWFLRDFGYDSELLAKSEVAEKALIGLQGAIKVSEVTVHGMAVLNFDGFAPSARWEELSVFADRGRPSEVSS